MKSKSKSAFAHNVGAEMNAGKPQKQALAIAYSIKRKGRKMAKGGEVYPVPKDQHYAEGGEVESPMREQSQEELSEHGNSKEHFLSAEEDMEPLFDSEPMSDSDELAEVDDEVHSSLDNEIGHEEPDQQRSDIVSSILRSIRMKHMGRK